MKRPPITPDPKMLLELAGRIAQHWHEQDGINGSMLDSLAHLFYGDVVADMQAPGGREVVPSPPAWKRADGGPRWEPGKEPVLDGAPHRFYVIAIRLNVDQGDSKVVAELPSFWVDAWSYENAKRRIDLLLTSNFNVIIHQEINGKLDDEGVEHERKEPCAT